jgi:hypothetical protein
LEGKGGGENGWRAGYLLLRNFRGIPGGGTSAFSICPNIQSPGNHGKLKQNY